jgi:serine/threonine protein phosphatase PrpC
MGGSRTRGDWAIEAAARSDVGLKRRSNEDAFGSFDDLAVYVVADGMGGHAAGEIASSLTVDAIRRSLTETVDADVTAFVDAAGNSSSAARRLVIAIEQANRSVLGRSRSDPQLSGMGTTVAAVFFDRWDGGVAIGHVGDSRVYRIRDGRIEQLTEDDTVVQQLIDQGRMRAEERRRSRQRHVLTQAVGVEETIRPNVRLERARAGDVFVLCTDGLHDTVEADEILRAVLTTGPGLETACARLIQLANERGGRDNSTVLIVRCNGAASGSD